MTKLPLLDLFSGIGGFSLGLERSGGFRTVAFAECEPYCQKVLAKHWPGVPIYDDVREVTKSRLAADGITGVRAICGGFPCQDISSAGKGAGIDGERSGLWREYARIIGDFRPDFAIVENVRMLLNRGGLRVLGDLAAIGYDAEWHVIPASAVGAPHRRDRVWIVAYPNGQGEHDGPINAEMEGASKIVANAGSGRRGGAHGGKVEQPGRTEAIGTGETMADTDRQRGRGWPSWGEDAKNAWQSSGGTKFRQWDVEPDVGRVANGVPARVDRLKSLGNAVVPQIPEIIGEILKGRMA